MAAGGEDRAAGDVQIVDGVYPAIRVDDAAAGMGGHARRTHVMRTSDDLVLPVAGRWNHLSNAALREVAPQKCEPPLDAGGVEGFDLPFEPAQRHTERIALVAEHHPVRKIGRLLRAKMQRVSQVALLRRRLRERL